MLLLDTCTLLWLASDQNKLSKSAVSALKENNGTIFVSAMSALEIGIKHRKKRLKLPLSPTEWYKKAIDWHGLTELPITGAIALKSTLLPPIHDDPIDRMIISTAQAHQLSLLTPDKHIQKYPHLTIIW